jgi:hypothetical protein
MSFGVKGLHAGDVDRENRKPKIEGPWLKEGTKKNERNEVCIAGR